MTSALPPVSLVIHGHYYQPPRENPWLEQVEVEPTAAPFHDWNERIEQECYRAVEAARVLGRTGRIAEMMNTLAWTSFNFGPTLLTWLEQAAPLTYRQLLEADRESVKRFGFGSALAHPYHHVILPLSSRRDKVTEVRWGIADFRRRFGREPQGMWLPETAVDEETLDVLAEEGIQFTILAPHQVTPLPPDGRPGLYRTSGGRTISLCIYDGDMSHDVAFGDLIRDAGRWIARVLAMAPTRPGGVIAVATDGETFGHHHKFGEMALARVINEFRVPAPSRKPEIRLENFAARLARAPATHEVKLIAPSSWSDPHGVERWRSDCGCGGEPGKPTQQKWRAPLREAMDWLASQLHEIFEREGSPRLGDAWAARDRYDPHLGSPPPSSDVRTRELLEMERYALMLFTSCAWFFEDIARIEPVQVLKYAARAIDLAGAEGPRLEAGLLERLAKAESNDRAAGTGRQIYLAKVKPPIREEARHAAGLAALVCAGIDPMKGMAAGYEATVERIAADIVRVHLRQRRTGREFKATVKCREHQFAVTAEADDPSTQGSWLVQEAALWDRHLRFLQEERRRTLVAIVLSPELQPRLTGGEITLAEAAQAALVEAVGSLGEGDTALPRVVAALDLLDQLSVAVPFDAQARFSRAVRTGIPTHLKPIADRLGFEVRA